MKRHYSNGSALLFFFVSLVTWHANGQFVECSSVMPQFESYDYTQVQSWNTSAFLSYQYDSPEAGASDLMRFRLLVPNGYTCSDATKYPLIVFLHGSGESAPYDANPFDANNTQDNDKHLVHGGQRHKNAVANNTFPGFVLYPQIRKSSNNNNYWGIDNIRAVRYIIDKLITDYKVDPDRIYIHGLSMGGEGTWIFLSNFPEYFAAAHVMSAAGSNFTNGTAADVDNYVHIPLRMSQGGLDSNPTPLEGNNQVKTIRTAGGNLEYTYYPNTGHATWNLEYAKTDFFSWFLARRKNMIMVLGGQTSFCPEDPISPSKPVTLGLSPGFVAYQWAEGDESGIIPGATSHEYQATAAGTYFARYQRSPGVWEPWSPAVVLDNDKGPSPTPTITTDNQSVNLPPLDGSPNVTLIGTPGKEGYAWTRNGSPLGTGQQTVTVNTAGFYAVRAKDPKGTGLEADNDTPTKFRATPQGCLSDPSEPVVVTTSNGVNVPAIPGNFFGSATAPTSITLSWDDRSANELGFEIYRTTTPGSNYKLITIRPASDSPNPQNYVDQSGLQANTTYYYRMRAVNTSGGSGYTPEIAVFTAVDNTPPTAPVLVVVATSRTAIDLSWSGATDNIAVHEYDIYQNGSLVATVPATTTTYQASGLIAFASYSFVVRARDAAGNISPPSNQVNPSAVNTGLFYSYYEHENNVNLTSQIIPNSTLVTTGYMPKFNITPRNRDDGFAFIHEGFINIPTGGSYTFFMTSDNGSVLYVNNVLVVNHDGNHSCTEKSGTPVTLSAGTYPVRAMYFEKTGGQCLTVSWAGPGFSKQEIPNSALSDTAPPPAPVAAPNTIAANAVGANRIDLTWVGPSNNETAFEIYRATAPGGPYQVVHLTAANATSWSDTGLLPGTQYYYRIRAINAETASPFGTPNPVNATTTNPSAPGVPVGLAAAPASATQVDLTWNDNSDELGYELQRSSSATDGFITFATTAANVTSVSDTQVNGHTTVYYRIRALGSGTAHSAYSAAVSATTPNRAPVFNPLTPDQTLTAGSGSAQALNITVTDPDNDPITFNVINMPDGGTFESDGFGHGVFSFTNVVAGGYTITVEASDGADMVSDQFLLTFSGNANPVVAVTIPDPWNGTLTTEEGRNAQIRFSVTDPDGNAQLNNSPVIAGLPGFGAASGWTNSGTGTRTLTINFTPDIGDAGHYPMTVTFRDSQNGITSVNLDLVVLQLDPTWSISVNFTIDDAKNEGAPWNNSGPPSVTAGDDKINLRDESGNIVKFVTMNTGQNWLTTNQPASELPSGPGAVFTEKVRESYYRKTSGTTNIIFKNLNPLLQYKATVYGAFAESGIANRETVYTVSGAGSEILEPLNTVNNISETRTSGFFYPNGSGQLLINVAKGGTNSGHYYINAVVLTAQLPTGEAPAAPSGLTLSAPSYDSVIVSWTDNSFNETGFQILRSATLNGTYNIVGTTADNVTTFVNTPVAGRTTYYYKVRAVNGATLSPETTPLVITTPNGAPVIADPGSISAPVGQTTQHNISATDPEGDAITFTALDLPAFAALVDNGNGTGFVRVMPQQGNIGSHLFTLRATDSFGTHTDRDVTIVVLDADVGEIVFINFMGAGAAGNAPAPWNNKVINDAPGLLNSEGQASAIQLTSDFPPANATNTGGINTGNNAGIFPDRVMQSYWYTTSTTTGQNITLSGLDPDARYNLTLFGSTDEFWFSNTTYTIAGQTPQVLNTTKNQSNTVRFSGIAPVGTSIVINVKRGVTPAVTEREGRIGAMIVESYLPDP
ncbi:MAG TPA: fibronectin type III domain-containing protein, partial [Ohtaekwangia sp.]|nr:fibronectin type III domain-containing protein [Ohtaekwangia sp.]